MVMSGTCDKCSMVLSAPTRIELDEKFHEHNKIWHDGKAIQSGITMVLTEEDASFKV